MEHFVIWSAGYNGAKYVRRHMKSVNNQTYKNYTAMIVDDASTDGTWKEINKYKTNKDLIHRNKVNVKNAANIVSILRPAVKKDDVIVILDLDDWFAHKDVLKILNEIYTSEECWMTYGHYKHLTHQQPMEGYPSEVVENRIFREHKWLWHHLKTFKGFLLHKIKTEDFQGPYGGSYPILNWDLAVGFPMLEMTPPEKLRYIPEILMVYNAYNPLMACKTYKKLRQPTTDYFRSKPKYDRLELGAGDL